jgi:Glyoxalase-like domain
MIRLRQVALVAHDLDAVISDLHETFGLEVAFRDPGVARYGLVNSVLPLGDQFIEVVSPAKEDTAAGRQLRRMGGDGGYMVICHTDDPAPFRKRAQTMGIRSVVDADHSGYRIWQLHPADTRGSFLEIDFQPGWDTPANPWMPAGPGWQAFVRTDLVDGIVGVELAVPDVDAVSSRWGELLGQPGFDNAALRWTTGTRGIAAIDIHAAERTRGGETRRICGVDFRVV